MTWRVCARVDDRRVSFALKITNGGKRPALLKIRLEYVQADQPHSCPGVPDTRIVSVPPATTLITGTDQCAGPRPSSRAAFQGAGWVLAANATGGSRKFSPTPNVYPDRDTMWKPDVV